MTSALSTTSHNPLMSVALICPSIDTSTSVMSGAGWLLIPDVIEKDLLLQELESYAREKSIGFDRNRASHMLNETQNARSFVSRFTEFVLDPVPAYADPDPPMCRHVQTCCTNDTRHIQNYGDYTCREAKAWYKTSHCCKGNTYLDQQSTWPTYLHLKHLLKDKVMSFTTKAGQTNSLIRDVIQNMFNAFEMKSGNVYVQGNVIRVEHAQTEWTIETSNRIVTKSKKVIFANGGFGAKATQEELSELAISSTAFVHARNTRLLQDHALQHNWSMDDLNAWFLEFVDGAPKWFLWEDKATVLTLHTMPKLVYDEASSYDERGRIRQKKNIPEATLVYATPDSNLVFSKTYSDDVPKQCDTRSKRLWRNFLAASYGIGSIVNGSRCAERVTSGDRVVYKTIHQGMIDTISGPAVNQHQQITSDPTAYAVGNAASPSLLKAYVGPGSTLGQALISGYIAGKHAARNE